MTFNKDNSFFMVICELGKTFHSPETEVADMTLQSIIADIKSGQIENVQAVFEFNPVEGWSNDITSEVMAAAAPETEDAGAGLGVWLGVWPVYRGPNDEHKIGVFEAGIESVVLAA